MSDLDDLSDYLSSDSSDDDDILHLLSIIQTKGGKKLGQSNNSSIEIVLNYNDKDFLKHFGINKQTAGNIAAQYEQSELYTRQCGKYGKISPMDQVLTFLWFICHPVVTFREVANKFDITISSLHRIIKKLAMFISNLAPRAIKWPNTSEKKMIEQHFRENGFPNVIGVIDCCHIKIGKPLNDTQLYANKYGYHSIQVQIVCDRKKKILDVVVGYPGSADARNIFEDSLLSKQIEAKCGSYFILGLNKYRLTKNVLTPFKRKAQLTERQKNYNIKLIKNYSVITHCVSDMKQKFQHLNHVKIKDISTIAHLIKAACVLQNMSMEEEFSFDNNVEQIKEEMVIEEEMDAKKIRDKVVNSLSL